MEKSSFEDRNISRSSSQSRRNTVTDRATFSNCSEKLLQSTEEYKETVKELKVLSEKIEKFKEKIERDRRSVVSCEIEIEKLRQGIHMLDLQAREVEKANKKIEEDTRAVLEEKSGVVKVGKPGRNQYEELLSRVKQERRIVDKLRQITEKMRKQVIIQQKIKDEAKARNKSYITKSFCIREKISRCETSAQDILFKLHP